MNLNLNNLKGVDGIIFVWHEGRHFGFDTERCSIFGLTKHMVTKTEDSADMEPKPESRGKIFFLPNLFQ